MSLAEDEVTQFALCLVRVRLAAEVVLADSRLTRWETAVKRAAEKYGWTEEESRDALGMAKTLSRWVHGRSGKLGRAVAAIESRRARQEEGK